MDIKFRAWDTEEKSMWSWEEIEKFWKSEGYCSTILGGDHWIPMRFTGVTNNDEEELYEGDIVCDPFDKEHKHPSVITFGLTYKEGGYETPGFDFEMINGRGLDEDYHREWKDLKKIGNIYENPELLS